MLDIHQQQGLRGCSHTPSSRFPTHGDNKEWSTKSFEI
jgi:hypothetical protein